jgi:hypothetical protein
LLTPEDAKTRWKQIRRLIADTRTATDDCHLDQNWDKDACWPLRDPEHRNDRQWQSWVTTWRLRAFNSAPAECAWLTTPNHVWKVMDESAASEATAIDSVVVPQAANPRCVTLCMTESGSPAAP